MIVLAQNVATTPVASVDLVNQLHSKPMHLARDAVFQVATAKTIAHPRRQVWSQIPVDQMSTSALLAALILQAECWLTHPDGETGKAAMAHIFQSVPDEATAHITNVTLDNVQPCQVCS